MEVFRIAREKYASSLTSSGTANRWNIKGQQVLYAGSSRSLASLELIVHKGAVQPVLAYKVMVISIADDDYLTRQIQIKDLPADWRSLTAYPILQNIGAAWYNSQASLVLKIPSAVNPAEHNYMINTEHPDFIKKVKLVRTEDYFWDSRLL
ncbi:MAG: RES family NAD+ phosphorylase [Ferruginibacter sp.]